MQYFIGYLSSKTIYFFFFHLRRRHHNFLFYWSRYQSNIDRMYLFRDRERVTLQNRNYKQKKLFFWIFINCDLSDNVQMDLSSVWRRMCLHSRFCWLFLNEAEDREKKVEEKYSEMLSLICIRMTNWLLNEKPFYSLLCMMCFLLRLFFLT